MSARSRRARWTRGIAVLTAFAACEAIAPSQIPSAGGSKAFEIGCQSNTFSRFTVFEAIEKTARAGGSVIEFQPDQKLSADNPDVLWNHAAPAWAIAKVKAKLAQHGIRAVGYGVVGIPSDEAGARKVFDFAQKVGLRTLITESVGSIDTLERLAKEYDIEVAFHHHPKRPNDPGYRLWDPNYVAQLVKGRDRRVGACPDTGNWTRSGVRPLDGLRTLRGRILCVHLKDMAEFDRRDAHEVPYGTGASGIEQCLDELKAQAFGGHIVVEYEYNPDGNLADVARCIQFLKVHLD